MLRRKVMDTLVEWKNRPHKCMLIKGQRQVGKTFIIRRFAESEYENLLEIDFSKDKSIRKVFESDLDVDRIVENLELITGMDITPGKTLLFFDEIQECMSAWSSLKYFTMDGRYDVIASGSLLGVTLPHKRNEDIDPLVPTGYQEEVTMYSLDFEEFLWANGMTPKIIESLKKKIGGKEPLGEIYLERFGELFRRFMVTGGMPESVQRYVETDGNLPESIKVLDNILSICHNDIIRYNKGVDQAKTIECFEAIPANLSESNKRFMYSRIDGSGSRNSAEKYMGNILWIKGAGIANVCYSLSQPALPLKGNEVRDVFRLYMSDTGLLLRMYGHGAANAVLTGDTSYNMGAAAENVVSECLVKSGFVPYYYRKNNGPDKMELDFVIETGAGLTVIEVKSGKKRDAPSLKKVSKFHEVDNRIIFDGKDILVDEDGIIHAPLFVSAFMDEMFGIPKLVDL